MDIYFIDKNTKLKSVDAASLSEEKSLQEILATQNNINKIREDFKFIGTEVHVGGRCFVDILAIDSEGKLIIFELKKDRGRRDIVAQILDYASRVENYNREDVERLIKNSKKDPKNYEEELEQFDLNQDNSEINHKLYIVTHEKEDGLVGIIEYLTKRKIFINSIYYKYLDTGDKKVLIIEKIMSDEEQEIKVHQEDNPTGYKYANIKWNSAVDKWEDYRKYGFYCAGGGGRYSAGVRNLKEGDKIVVYKKYKGFLGYGEIIEEALPAKEFKIDGKTLKELNIETDCRDAKGEDTDYFVRVNWIKTVSEEEGINDKRISGYRNTVCNIYDNKKGRAIVDTLKEKGLIV